MKSLVYVLIPLLASAACNKKSDKSGTQSPPSLNTIDVLPGKGGAPTSPVAGSVTTLPAALTVTAQDFECDALDYGIYWFGKGEMAQKASSKTTSTFYDPTKPTMIYIHGWQAGSHLFKKRATFNYSKADPFEGPKVDAADAWIDAGWNIGIFYWNQFGDETKVKDAEDKVWEDKSVTWQNCAGKALTTGVPKGSVADLLFSNYSEVMKGYTGPEVRLAGHSLGNQLVTRLAAKAADASKAGTIDAHLVPKRVALLDPFWSAALGGESRGAAARALITPLKAQGMIFEMYKTSDITDSVLADSNEELAALIGRTNYDLTYYS
ncbi:MAG: hypothetical protein EOP10_32330, partial [Proteobacteria bacterium]